MSKGPGQRAAPDAHPEQNGAPWTVFLDRDGVFNVHMPHGVVRWEDFEWLPGVQEAFARLNRPDIQTCLCTNQPRVGMLAATAGMVRRVNERLRQELEEAGGRLDRIETAMAPAWMPHRRRKPRPGMLEDGARALGDVDPARSVMVGDKIRDAQAGERFGARTILLTTTTPEATLRERARRAHLDVDAYCSGLPEAVDVILRWIDQD